MSKVINISEVYEENRSNRMSKKMIIAILKNTISSLEDYDNVPESKKVSAIIEMMMSELGGR
jgi:hypothetical protein